MNRPDSTGGRLPALREDLQITRGGTSYSGDPLWIVLDPVRNRFFRVTYEMFQLLFLWNISRNAKTLIAAIRSRFGREVEEDEIGAVIGMLDTNYLLERPLSGSWRGLHAVSQRRHSWFMGLIHNYLFFKIPLVRPDAFIRATWPYVAPLFSRTFLVFTILIGIGGLYLASRQWDAFVSTFPYVFSLEGAALSLLSIVFIKSLHELGHAYVAHRNGCRVPTMGVAFMVMIPLLYTDVSDAWRLRSRRARLAIDFAGIATELHVAAFALVLWAFVPDGPLRSAVFVLAATGWVMSIVVNLNPFMRFDGYYIFADLIGIENLQPRAFRHMRWRLRKFLFNTGEVAPETFPRRLDALITVYAILTAIYRLVLYLGIALLVYHFTIKLIGIVLFAVEIGFFIVRPCWMELKEWWSMRHEILKSRRTWLSLSVAAGLIALSAMPLSTHINAPAVVFPKNFARLYPGQPGQIASIEVRRGNTVAKGDTLFVIRAPALEQERRITDTEIMLASLRLARAGAAAGDLVQRGILESQLAALIAKRTGLEERQAKLVIIAPFDGRIADISAEIAVGQWVSGTEQLAILSDGSDVVLRGYVADSDLRRLSNGASGVFIPDDPTLPKLDIALASVALSGAHQIDIPQLTSHYNGKIAVHPPETGNSGRLAPVSSQYAVTARVLDDLPAATQTWSGVARFEGAGESMLARIWRQGAKVLIREAGI